MKAILTVLATFGYLDLQTAILCMPRLLNVMDCDVIYWIQTAAESFTLNECVKKLAQKKTTNFDSLISCSNGK